MIDLGAAPGGWSQVAVDIVGQNGRVVGIDILPIVPLPEVILIQGDFREPGPLADLREVLGNVPVDLVLSDMAPNLSGIAVVDQARAIYLCELALDLCREVLKPGGVLVVKVFQGTGFDSYLKELKAAFQRVNSRKPKASRAGSREVYVIARGFRIVSSQQP